MSHQHLSVVQWNIGNKSKMRPWDRASEITQWKRRGRATFVWLCPAVTEKKKKSPSIPQLLTGQQTGKTQKKINVEPLGRRRVVFLKHPMSAGRVKRRRRRSA